MAMAMVAKAPCQAEAYPHGRRGRWRLRGGRCGWRRCGGDGETVGDDGGAETAVAMVVAMAAARVAEVEEGGEGGCVGRAVLFLLRTTPAGSRTVFMPKRAVIS